MSAPFPVDSQQRMCHSKRPYLSETAARIAIDGHQRRDPSLVLRVYQCPNCGFWHLTKSPLKGASRPADQRGRPAMTRKS